MHKKKQLNFVEKKYVKITTCRHFFCLLTLTNLVLTASLAPCLPPPSFPRCHPSGSRAELSARHRPSGGGDDDHLWSDQSWGQTQCSPGSASQTQASRKDNACIFIICFQYRGFKGLICELLYQIIIWNRRKMSILCSSNAARIKNTGLYPWFPT